VDRRTYIVGVGASRYGWRLQTPVPALVLDACTAALADAGLAVDEVDAIVTESSYVPLACPADRALYELGHDGECLTATSGIGGAGNVGALGIADALIRHSGCRNVLCYFGEDFGSAAGGPYAFPVGVETKQSYEAPHGWFGQPVYFAAMAERYAAEYGLDPAALARVAVAARRAAALTPDAVLTKPLDLDAYFQEPPIAGPLRRADCSVVADGASAWVVSAGDVARDRPRTPVAVLGVGNGREIGHSSDTYFTQRPSFTRTPCVGSAAQAFGRAGVTPADVDVAEIYDCFTISTILQLEDAGFCGKGEGAAFVASGAIDLDGRLPTNTHGGLLAHSYTVGAEHIVEAVHQLRGDGGPRQVVGARVAFVSGMGLPEHASAVLGVA
jgi:acetyl-CoA acetyltransferase